jgi:phosphatidylglycerol lysyltransferase
MTVNRTSLIAARGAGRAARLLPATLAILGAVAGISVSIAAGATAGSALADWLPLDPASIDPLEGVACAVGLAAIGLGLARRKRLAWFIALSVFVAAAIDDEVVSHPIAAGLAIGCLAVLAADRHRYRVASDRRALRPALAIAIVIVAAVVLQAALFDITGPLWAAPVARLQTVVDALADTLALSGPDVSGAAPLLAGLGPVVDVAARLALVVVALLTLRSVPSGPPSPRDLLRGRSIARRYARGALRPFQLGDDKLVYAPPDHRAVVAYGEAGRFAVMLGDPIGPERDGLAVLRSFVQASEVADHRVAAYQVSERWTAPFSSLGFRLIRIGSEAIVDLDGFDVSGSRRANLRHAISRARRGGVRVEWFPKGPTDRRLREELRAIDEEWRRSRRGPELAFTIHGFEAVHASATAVAFEADGRPSAFATFQPTARSGWVLDLMRRRRGTPGALEWCIAEAAMALAAGGARELSLGLAPLASRRPDGPIEERLIQAVAGSGLVRRAYDVRGLEFFKDKFAPRWEARYLAMQSRTDLVGIVVALLRLHVGGSRTSLLRTVARVYA